VRHQIGFLLAVFFGTVWYGTVATVAGFIGLKRRPGSLLDTVGRDWSNCLLRSAGVTVTLHGFEHVPTEGPVIIAVNHQSFFDIIAVLGTVPLPLKFIAKKELLRYPFFGTAIRAAGHIFIDRFNRMRAFEAYETAGRELRERRAHVVVFPEGTRSRTGRLLPFKKGPAVFAISSGTPVVPAYCAGTFGIQPKGSWFIRPRAVTIHFGAPLCVARLTHEDRDAFTERLREAILALRAGSVDAEY
jgi:1-acyl-sn-glycerol-3-phosphate acyltransferase